MIMLIVVVFLAIYIRTYHKWAASLKLHLVNTSLSMYRRFFFQFATSSSLQINQQGTGSFPCKALLNVNSTECESHSMWISCSTGLVQLFSWQVLGIGRLTSLAEIYNPVRTQLNNYRIEHSFRVNNWCCNNHGIKRVTKVSKRISCKAYFESIQFVIQSHNKKPHLSREYVVVNLLINAMIKSQFRKKKRFGYNFHNRLILFTEGGE